MSNDKNFGYLGNTFQIQLLNNIVIYKEFSNSIIDVIDPQYFDNQYFKELLMKLHGEEWEKEVELSNDFKLKKINAKKHLTFIDLSLNLTVASP